MSEEEVPRDRIAMVLRTVQVLAALGAAVAICLLIVTPPTFRVGDIWETVECKPIGSSGFGGGGSADGLTGAQSDQVKRILESLHVDATSPLFDEFSAGFRSQCLEARQSRMVWVGITGFAALGVMILASPAGSRRRFSEGAPGAA